MFGVSFSELFVIAVVCLFLLDVRSLGRTIASARHFLRKLFEIKDEVQEAFADIGKEMKPDVDNIVGSDKKLHVAVDVARLSAKTLKVKKAKKKI